MRGYLVSLGYNNWKAMETKYVPLVNGLNTSDKIQTYEKNEKKGMLFLVHYKKLN